MTGKLIAFLLAFSANPGQRGGLHCYEPAVQLERVKLKLNDFGSYALYEMIQKVLV